MTEVIQKGKKVPRYNFYPKSSAKRVAKIQMKPKYFRAEYKNVDYLALGDSFVNMFLHAENVFFIKLKGKSLKGLAKCDKQERKYIEDWVDAMQTSCELIFNFGQVDLNFIRYYKLVKGETYPDETFQEYIEWIGSLNRKSIVLGILASPIKEKHIYDVLQKYKTLEGSSEVDWEAIKEEHKKTQQVRKRWNGLIESACKKHGVKFINVFEYGKQLEEKFLDQNPLTVHLRYLPTLIEVQKQLPRLFINIEKSLQIENEYVTQKTSRYYKNLEIFQERKRLQSIESQETKTENNSSRDGTEVDDQEPTRQDRTIISGDQLLDVDENEQTVIKQKQSLLDEIDFDNEGDEDYSYVTPQVLLQQMVLQKRVTSYCTRTFLFHIGRLIDNDDQQYTSTQTDCVILRFLSELIQYGVDSIDIQYSLSQPTWMLEMTQSLTTMVISQEGKQKLTKMFVRILQKLFEKSLNSTQNILANQTITLQIMVRFIICIFQNQFKFQFPLIKDKLIIRIGQILIGSLFDTLLLPDTEPRKFTQFSCSIFMFRDCLYQFSQKTLINKLEKLKITEDELCNKFKSIVQQERDNTQDEIKKVKQQFSYLLYQKYPFAVCSQKVLTLMIGQIQRKYQQKMLSILVNTFLMKLKAVEIDLTFKRKLSQLDQDFNKKIEQIQNEKREHYHKSIDPNDRCCSCGCLLGMPEMLKKNQDHKLKNERLKEVSITSHIE